MGILFGFWSDVRFQLVVVATQESQPAVQVATRAAASRLCRHSAQTHTPYNASVLSRVLIETRVAAFWVSGEVRQFSLSLLLLTVC